MIRLPLAAAVALLLASRVAHAQTTVSPRYFSQMQAELQAMGLAAQCTSSAAQTGRCIARSPSSSSARRYVLALEYDDNSDTIYAYVDHYAVLRADSPNSATAFRRLLELNWEMLAARFEWSSTSGEVRLSAVMNTDSNFDRRAFRGVVRSLVRLADRYADEVARLTGSAVGEAAPIVSSPAPAAGR